jgi:hypothetical protein
MTPTVLVRPFVAAIAAAAIAICLPGSVPSARAGADALVGAPITAKTSSAASAYSAASFPLLHLGTTAKRCNYIVGYQVNQSALVSATGAPDVAVRATVLAVVKAAVADLSSRTGQPYRYDGTTTFSPTLANFRYGPDDLVIVIKGSANNNFYAAAAPGTYLAGMTRWLIGGAGTSVVEISPAMIDLRTAKSRSNLYATFQHELAHSVGLQHSKNAADVMFAQLNPATPAVYSKADTAALAASPCRS